MPGPLATTVALLAGVTLSVAGCTRALEPSSKTASTASDAPASSQTDDESLLRVLENLRRASLESHLPLFELAAENGGFLTAEQMPSELGASHSDMRRGGHEDRAMRGEKRDEGHGPQHRS